MTNFVLVHGGMHGGWCWEKIVPRLEARGHRAWAPDLPGLESCHPLPAGEVSLAMQGDYIAKVIVDICEPVVLVGHSMGGCTISEAAERVPERILGLVYATANLLPSGETMLGWASRHGNSKPNIRLSEDGLTMLPPEHDQARDMFYNMCSAEDVDRAVRRLLPQPLRVRAEPLKLSDERYGSVPRCYIECLRDNTLPLAMQRLMTSHLPCDPVFQMDCDHSPFISKPDDFTGLLLEAEAAFLNRTHA